MFLKINPQLDNRRKWKKSSLAILVALNGNNAMKKCPRNINLFNYYVRVINK